MPDPQERIGQSVGNYRLLRLLGMGNFGIVYLAEHLDDHTSAAVKLLRVPLTGHNALRAFLNEARMMRLHHPHIVPILDFGLSHDDLPYLVMAYAEGGTLRDRHPKGSKLSSKTIDTYVQQLASALQHAHDGHVIHRDVKPENMLVDSDGSIQLGDFGIARISERASASSLHKNAGTPAYAAPEQSQGRPCPASDQYSLAIVVYEWLSGQRPFQGDHFAVLLQHRRDAPPPLRAICPELSPQVEQVILKALAKAPQDRFSTITHFAQALHTALQGDIVPTQLPPNLGISQISQSSIAPVSLPDALPSPLTASEVPLVLAQTSLSPQPASPNLPSVDTPGTRPVEILQSSWPVSVQQQTPFTVRLRRTLLILLCSVLLLGGGGATWLFVTQQAQQQIHDAHSATATAVVVQTETVQAGIDGYRNYVAMQGIMFGFNAQHTRVNPYEHILNIANVSQLHQKWIASTGNKINSSPAVANGLVYVGSDDHKLYAFDATSGQVKWVAPTGGGIYSSPAVANGLVYVGSVDSNLYAFDAINGQVKWAASTGDGILSSPAVANGLVYVGAGSVNASPIRKKVFAFDAVSGQLKWAASTSDGIFSSPAVANGLVYVGSVDKKVYAFDAISGNLEWVASTGNSIYYSSPTVANGLVYVGSDDGKLYAFDATNGKQKWVASTGDRIQSSPAIANGLVYVGSADHQLYALDAATGQQKWVTPTGNSIFSSPAIANGLVYIGSDDHNLYAFDATTGQQKWVTPTGDGIVSSPAIVNGVVYIASYDHNVYAFVLSASS